MSRSARSVIGVILILMLLGAGSGYAVARWGQKDAPEEWRPDWNAVVRGGSCVTGELRDVVRGVASLLAPDRPRDEDGDPVPTVAIGRGGDLDATADTGQPPAEQPLATFVENTQDFFASLSDEVPRIDDGGPGSGC